MDQQIFQQIQENNKTKENKTKENTNNQTQTIQKKKIKKGRKYITFTKMKNQNEFNQFLKTRKLRSIKEKIESFVENFDRKEYKTEEVGKKVSDFIKEVSDNFDTNHVSRKTLKKHDPKEVQMQTYEYFESNILKKIYNKVFFLNGDEDVFDDQNFFERLDKLSFIQFSHLKLPKEFFVVDKLEEAMQSLREINSLKAPKEKLLKISECIQHINDILVTNESKRALFFFPLLVYVILHSNTPNLKSNIRYIQRFSQQTRILDKQIEVNFSLLKKAANFLETLTASELDIDPEIFNTIMKPQDSRNTSINPKSIRLKDMNSNEKNKSEKKSSKYKFSESNDDIMIQNKSSQSLSNEESEKPNEDKNHEDFEQIEKEESLSDSGDDLSENDLQNKYPFYNFEFDDLQINQINTLYSDYQKLIKENRKLKLLISKEETKKV